MSQPPTLHDLITIRPNAIPNLIKGLTQVAKDGTLHRELYRKLNKHNLFIKLPRKGNQPQLYTLTTLGLTLTKTLKIKVKELMIKDIDTIQTDLEIAYDMQLIDIELDMPCDIVSEEVYLQTQKNMINSNRFNKGQSNGIGVKGNKKPYPLGYTIYPTSENTSLRTWFPNDSIDMYKMYTSGEMSSKEFKVYLSTLKIQIV